MKPQEPPCGSRMLEKVEDDANSTEPKPAPSENAVTNAEEVPDTKSRRTPRKRRKPFVL